MNLSQSLRHPSFWLLLIGATLILSSCGSSSVTTKGAAKQPLTNPGTNPIVTNPAPDLETGIPSQQFSFEVHGESPSIVTPELTTDNLLNVKLTAQAGGRNRGTNQYTNFAANYNCATFKVTLEIDSGAGWAAVSTQTTSPLAVAGTNGCPGGVQAQVINYSKFLLPGAKRVRIKLQAMRSDFYCLLYRGCVNAIQYYGRVPADCTWMSNQVNMEQYVCPLKDIYQYHTVNGTAELQVNGTAL